MNPRGGRDLSVPGQKRSLRYLLQSIFCTELMAPSRPLWLSSGWISNIPVVDNSARQFQDLCPDWDARPICLSECLEAICDRGGRVAVVLRDDPHNQKFINNLKSGKAHQERKLVVIIAGNQHVKGLVGELVMIGGSMNFTFNGIEVNEEDVQYRCDPAAIHEKRLSLEERWGKELPWGRDD